MYVMKDQGESVVKANNEKKLEGTQIIFTPKDVKHAIMNTGEELHQVISFYIQPLKPIGYFNKELRF